jgi:aryl-phospho-beta-D-glucosidase BglC (GH1 family)
MSQDHWLRIYGSSKYTFEDPKPIDTAEPSARVVEKHPSTSAYMRGVHEIGGAYCVNEHSGEVLATSPFSNHTPYVYEDGTTGLAFSAKFGENACYHHDTPASLAFLAKRGVKLVRLDFRWERVQQDVGGRLRSTDVKRIRDWVRSAQRVGLTPIIDLHNYGHLFVWNSTLRRGVRTAIGSEDLPISAFADLWRRLSTVFKNEGNVIYDLMNEPEGLAPDAKEGSRIWEKASQAALNAIRANGDKHLVLVEGYDWSGVRLWSKHHPRGWIRDPARNFRYEAHHYWNREGSGYYTHTYDDEVADSREQGF